jgi:hypothetical protein
MAGGAGRDCADGHAARAGTNTSGQRKRRLETLLRDAALPLRYSNHQEGRGPEMFRSLCAVPEIEGMVSKRTDAAYVPGNRGLWRKTKSLNREEFVIVGWTEPEGSRPHLGALLLAYYEPRGTLVYAGRAGTGIDAAELKRLRQRLEPLGVNTMPLDVPPPRGAALALRSCSRGCTGCGRSLSPRFPFSPGPMTACCAKSSIKGFAKTRSRARSPETCPAIRRQRHERRDEPGNTRTYCRCECSFGQGRPSPAKPSTDAG